MKTVVLPQNTFGVPSKNWLTYRPNVPVENRIRVHLNKFYLSPVLNAANLILRKSTEKLTTKYFMNALNEVLKQNLLGSDINMEFLILNIRVYSSMAFRLIVKSSAALHFKMPAGRTTNSSSREAAYSFIN